MVHLVQKSIRRCLTNRHLYVMENVEKHMMVRYMFQDSTLKFSVAVNMVSITATDCWAFFAPLLADVVCCPQFDATLATLIGYSSKSSGMLSLNATHAKHCLSDVEKILGGQEANKNIQKICSIRPENLTAASCPVTEVDMFESTVDSSKLVAACKNVDPVNKCCDQVCQNAILDAARTIAAIGMPNSEGVHELPEQSTRIDDCKTLRGLSSCKVNKVSSGFPNMTNVVKERANVISNETACCNAMDSYVSRLQEQSFITNLQALNCAASLGEQLLKANVSNFYNLCRINLKDFSLQVGSQEYGCLLPSLPLDATYDKTSGISFVCDLNDNVAAPWPSLSSESPSSCKKSMREMC